jgi:LacI family transcriptional regulator
MTTVHAPTPDASQSSGAPGRPLARRATLQDVAAAAGVSVSAVSKVVRGAYGVSDDMRTRVEAAVAALGYRPHAGARAMRGRSFTVGVVVVELTSPFQPEVARGVAEQLESSAFQDVVVTAGTEPARQRRAIEALLDRQVDGRVLVAPWLEAEWIEEFAQRVPLVSVALHGPAQHFDTVVDDDALGARLMIDHLVALGHRRIVHTSMPGLDLGTGFDLSHTARTRGFADAMRAHGLDVDIIETHYSEQGGYDAATQALSRTEPPTAIFAGADIAALGVLRAAEDHRMDVPRDLTVVGYDNIFISTVKRVALTTIDQSSRLTGAAAARLLLERIDGRTAASRYIVAPRLIVRDTSGPVPPTSVGKPQPSR